MRVLNVYGIIEEKMGYEILETLDMLLHEEEQQINTIVELLGGMPDDEFLLERLEPLQVNISSPGGDCYIGAAIMDKLDRFKCDVITFADGLVASMGFHIYLAGKTRKCGNNATFLHHSMSLGGMPRTTLPDLQLTVDYWNAWQDRMNQTVADRTNITMEMQKEHVREDWTFFKEEAIELGVVNWTETDDVKIDGEEK